ncbi:MAG: N-acetylneuraminate synthase family protein [Elusimicrobiota bacterium]|jgi:N-acetylneuraminate synthase/N,N'-diacetyllegionaminate synthase
MKSIRIGKRVISEDTPPFVVAEAGVNHNAKPELAIQLIEAAAQAGADAIKFQNYKAERLVTKSAPVYWNVPGAAKVSSQFELFNKLDGLPPEAYRDMMQRAKELGIVLFSTPFSEADTDFLEKLGVPAYKLASADITHHRLLRHVARTGKPVILSTGTCTLGEIEEAVEVVRKEGNEDIILLHCTLTYPTPFEDANLRMIPLMQSVFPECPIGLSDHTYGVNVAIAATALGCKMMEKHYTLDKGLPDSPDHKFGVDPKELKSLVDGTRQVFAALGNAAKRPVASEAPAKAGARRSVVTTQPVAAGQRLEESALDCKRPGTGISPKHFDLVLGRRAKKDIPADTVLQWEMLD